MLEKQFVKLTISKVVDKSEREIWVNKAMIQVLQRDAIGEGAIVSFGKEDYIEVNESVEEILGIQKEDDNTEN